MRQQSREWSGVARFESYCQPKFNIVGSIKASVIKKGYLNKSLHWCRGEFQKTNFLFILRLNYDPMLAIAMHTTFITGCVIRLK